MVRYGVERVAARLNRYEVQARLSVIMAGVSVLFLVAAAIFVFDRFNWKEFEVVYNPRTMRFMAIVGAVGMSGLTGAVGFFSGIASAGHKRNKLSHWSWTGFFVSAVSITLAMCLFVLFWFAKEPIVM